MVENLRVYGPRPHRVVVVHGGPGAPGEMAPVARELSSTMGVLEPLQTETTLQGQVDELTAVIRHHATVPVTLIGWSWGGHLSFLVAASHPELVSKLILVCSSPFTPRFAGGIRAARLARLNDDDRKTVEALRTSLGDPETPDKNERLAQIAKLYFKADTLDPITTDTEAIEVQLDVNQSVSREAGSLRTTGDLLRLADDIRCPVVAIHGDYDPHPADGVRLPLERVLSNFRFVLLERCGHYPWLERQARDRFFSLLRSEIDGESE